MCHNSVSALQKLNVSLVQLAEGHHMALKLKLTYTAIIKGGNELLRNESRKIGMSIESKKKEV